MGADKIPQARAGVLVIEDHILDMKNVVCDPVDHITVRLIFLVIINSRHYIV